MYLRVEATIKVEVFHAQMQRPGITEQLKNFLTSSENLWNEYVVRLKNFERRCYEFGVLSCF